MIESNLHASATCPKCGNVIDAISRFCNHCGSNLAEHREEAEAVSLTTSEPKNNKRVFLLIGGLLGVAILALAVGYLLKKNRSHTESSASTSTQSSAQTMSARAQQIEEKILRGENLTQADIAGLSAYELRVLRNIHFARYGRTYDRPGLGDYFFTRAWYHPSDSYNDNLITATDKANINLILAEENTLKAATASSSSASSETSSTPSTNPLESPPKTSYNPPSESTSVSEFRHLNVAAGDYLMGYKAVNRAASAAEVVQRFGKPVKSADLNDFYKSKVLFYKAQDEFENPCYVKLQFVPICGNGLSCFHLVGIATEPQ